MFLLRYCTRTLARELAITVLEEVFLHVYINGTLLYFSSFLYSYAIL